MLMIHFVPPGAWSGRVRQRGRRGFSLLEVLLALAVFGAGIAGLTQCLHVAQRAGARAQFDSSALIRCKTIHGLLDTGALHVGDGKPRGFEDDARWRWFCEERPAPVPGLAERVVTVEYSTGSAVEGSRGRRRFSLSRLVSEAPGLLSRDRSTIAPRIGRGKS